MKKSNIFLSKALSLRADRHDLRRRYDIAGITIGIDRCKFKDQRVVDMVIEMKIALVGLCKFKFSFVGAGISGELQEKGIAANGIDRRYLIHPGADDQQPAAGKIAAVGEFQVYIQVLVGLNGIVDGCYAYLWFATTALAARPCGNEHHYQYSRYQK